MHETNLTGLAVGGDDPRRRLQGSSLFALDGWGEENNKERTYGYSLGQLKIEDDKAHMRIWPRRAQKIDVDWVIGADNRHFVLPDDRGTARITVKEAIAPRSTLPTDNGSSLANKGVPLPEAELKTVPSRRHSRISSVSGGEGTNKAASSDSALEPVRLFYSYSHKDEKLRERLQEHISMLLREDLIQDWHDWRITAGQGWEGVIDENLEASSIILLLVSPSFLASTYCYNIEMSRALEKHKAGEARVIPIILRPVDWSGVPFALLQALPKDAKPITTWPNRDLAWYDVAKGIRKVVEELVTPDKSLP